MRYAFRWVFCALLAATTVSTIGPHEASAQQIPIGTRISNTASTTYTDSHNNVFTVESNTVDVTVSAVSALTVTPVAPVCDPARSTYAQGALLTRTFVITNASNIPDAYTIAAAKTSAGSIASLSFLTPHGSIPITLASTVSQTVDPGQSITVQMQVATTAIPLGTAVTLSLTAQTTVTGTAGGLQSATGVQCAVGILGAIFTGLDGVGSPIQKRVNGLPFVSVPAATTVTYSIPFLNAGTLLATNALLTDVLPNGVQPDLPSLTVNGTPATAAFLNGTLTVPLGAIPPHAQTVVSFAAALAPSILPGTSISNTATIAADNAPSVTSLPAVILVGAANIVFAGLNPTTRPVPNAVITILDPATGAPVALTGSPAAPNMGNVDPFTVGFDGLYAFGFGSANLNRTYVVTISAPGYVARKIGITLVPAIGSLYSVTATALDGQPLAVPGGYALTPGPVVLANVQDLFGNLPLFPKASLTLSKTVDRSVASAGDRLVWTLTYQNTTNAPLGLAHLVDALPRGVAYAPHTARLDNVPLEPTISGQQLTWTFPSLDTAQHTVTFATVLVPGIAEGSLITNVATINASYPHATGIAATASASADVTVTAGFFSSCTTIVGRVYLDVMNQPHFVEGDHGLPNVRVFLESGESVTTDPFGRYSFGCVREGMHVAEVDTTTLPPNAHPYVTRRYDSEHSILRLVHGIFDGVTLQDVNFGIEALR